MLRAEVEKDPAKKLANLDEAVRTAPGDAAVLRLRAAVLADQGKDEAALDDINAASDIEPDDTDTLSLKATLLAKMKKFDEAIAAVDAIRKLEPNSAKPLGPTRRDPGDAGGFQGGPGRLRRGREDGPAKLGDHPPSGQHLSRDEGRRQGAGRGRSAPGIPAGQSRGPAVSRRVAGRRQQVRRSHRRDRRAFQVAARRSGSPAPTRRSPQRREAAPRGRLPSTRGSSRRTRTTGWRSAAGGTPGWGSASTPRPSPTTRRP